MDHLVANGETLSALARATGLTEVRDPAGKVVGYFAPVALENGAMAATVAGRIDWADVHAKKGFPKGSTTREVFEHLLSLSEDEQAHLRRMIAELKEREECRSP
jgi:hypothetical protein